MKKQLRLKVWNKYDKHCAYCGKKLEYKDMQIDHKFPKMLKHWLGTNNLEVRPDGKGLNHIDDFENLMPSCKNCNYHKHTLSLEDYRKEIKLKINRVKNSNIKLLERYGLVKFYDIPVIFYFEKIT